LGVMQNTIQQANTADALLQVGEALSCSRHVDGTLVKNIPGENNPTGVYLLENGKRRPIGAQEIFVCNNFDSSKIVAANYADAALAVGTAVTCPTTTAAAIARPL
ncbi:MAG: hypothetical protein M3Q64_02370, partial [bacterium]|nr:hypothetical protein [bacterium]